MFEQFADIKTNWHIVQFIDFDSLKKSRVEKDVLQFSMNLQTIMLLVRKMLIITTSG